MKQTAALLAVMALANFPLAGCGASGAEDSSDDEVVTESSDLSAFGKPVDILPKDELSSHDNFGSSIGVSADGSILVIGAPGTWAKPTPDAPRHRWIPSTGAVYTFRKLGKTWVQLGARLASTTGNEAGGHAYARLGEKLALSADGKHLAVADRSSSECVLLFDLDASGSSWVYRTTVFPEIPAVDGRMPEFGKSLAISEDGDTLVVGSASAAVDGVKSTGVVYVYRADTLNRGAFAREILFPASIPTANRKWASVGKFVSVSANGNTIAFSGGSSAHVFKFARGSGWSPVSLPAPTAPFVESRAMSISPDGKSLVTTGYYAIRGSNHVNSGTVVYQDKGGAWSQGAPMLVGPEVSPMGGWTVSWAANGNTFAVLGPGPFKFGSAAVMFARSGGGWKKLTGSINPKAGGFSDSIAMSGDGRSLFYGFGGTSPTYTGGARAYFR